MRTRASCRLVREACRGGGKPYCACADHVDGDRAAQGPTQGTRARPACEFARARSRGRGHVCRPVIAACCGVAPRQLGPCSLARRPVPPPRIPSSLIHVPHRAPTAFPPPHCCSSSPFRPHSARHPPPAFFRNARPLLPPCPPRAVPTSAARPRPAGGGPRCRSAAGHCRRTPARPQWWRPRRCVSVRLSLLRLSISPPPHPSSGCGRMKGARFLGMGKAARLNRTHANSPS